MNMLSVVREIERLKKLAWAKKVELSRKQLNQLPPNDERVLNEKINAFNEVRRSLQESIQHDQSEDLKISLKVIEKNILKLETIRENHLEYVKELKSLNMFVEINMKKFIRENSIKFQRVEIVMTKAFRKDKDHFMTILHDNGFLLDKSSNQSIRYMRFYTVELCSVDKKELDKKLARELFVDYSLIVGNFRYSRSDWTYMEMLNRAFC